MTSFARSTGASTDPFRLSISRSSALVAELERADVQAARLQGVGGHHQRVGVPAGRRDQRLDESFAFLDVGVDELVDELQVAARHLDEIGERRRVDRVCHVTTPRRRLADRLSAAPRSTRH